MCTVYILYSNILARYYVGHTCGPLEERMAKHLSGHKGFTGRAKDWVVVHTETFFDKMSARKRELEIKKWKSAKKICELITKG